jgi:hypothetical protein
VKKLVSSLCFRTQPVPLRFGVKAGDLLVSPLGRVVEMVGVGLMVRLYKLLNPVYA